MCASGRDCRAAHVRKGCGATPHHPQGFTRGLHATGKVSHRSGHGWQDGPFVRRVPESLTAPPRPLHFATDSGGRSRGRFPTAGKQGTPVRFRDGPAAVTRRRGRLFRAIATHIRSREGMQPAEPGSQKTYQTS